MNPTGSTAFALEVQALKQRITQLEQLLEGATWERDQLTEVCHKLEGRIAQLEEVLRFTRDVGFNASKINKVLEGGK